MNTVLSEEHELPPFVTDATLVLIALTTSIHDWHREVFESALSDLLQQVRKAPSVIHRVRGLLSLELNIPYSQQWRVSETEFEKRRVQVFQSLQRLHGQLKGNQISEMYKAHDESVTNR